MLPFKGGYRHLKRFRQIANTLARHGFGLILDHLGMKELITWRRGAQVNEGYSWARRVRMVLEELGPTFVKLGQVFSTRADLFPQELVDELRYLQDQVESFASEQVRAQIEQELGQPVAGLWTWFDQDPLAAASIGQVHRAQLPDGRQVVIKVQRPGVAEAISTDLEILFHIARLADRHTEWGRRYRFEELVEEFAITVRQELDYLNEGRNAERLARAATERQGVVVIPGVIWDLTTSRVLTMEYVDGVAVSRIDAEGQGINRHRLAVNLVNEVLQQILLDGVFHADPHPGNLKVLPGEALALIDFGLVGRLAPQRRQQLGELVMGIIQDNSSKIVNALLAMGMVTTAVDRTLLRREVELLRDRYYELSWKEVHLGKVVSEMLQLAYRFQIRMPPDMALLIRAIITLEGTARMLDPRLSIAELAIPLGRQLLLNRFEPRKVWHKTVSELEELWQQAAGLPRQLFRVVDQLQAGEAKLKLELEQLGVILFRLDRISNKLSFAIVLLAFAIVMASLIIGSALSGTAQLFFGRIPILELGMGVAALMLVWLLLAIFRSGWF